MERQIEFHRTDKPYFIMMVGLAGSGKSTISEQIQIEHTNGTTQPVVHSSDTIRKELYGDERDQEHNAEVFAELHRRIKDDLKNGKDVVYDATNINKKKRVAFLAELKNIDCHKVCACVMTPYEVCLKYNQNRERHVPDEAIRRMYMNWNPPDYAEGFDEITIAFNYGEQSKDDYSISKLFDNINDMAQDNKHHSLTLGQHCQQAAGYIQRNYTDSPNLLMATLLHDNGKVFTKTYINSKGENDGQAHYYQHHCVGAYDAMFYLDAEGLKPEDQIYISNLIYYHMHPYMSWEQSQKALNRDKKLIGDKMFNDVMRLHEADAAAHAPIQEIEFNIIQEEQGEFEIER